MSFRSPSEIASYHAHVYFESGSGRAAAETIRSAVGERFAVRLGQWREASVGPHSKAMFQIAFAPDLFQAIVPWLMLNHQGLSILVHPNTRNPKRDHLQDALWIGPALELKGEILPEDQAPDPAGPPNTVPTINP